MVKALRDLWNRLPDRLRKTIGVRHARRSMTTSWAIARHNARLKPDAPVLNFFPERPLPRAQLVGVLGLLGIRIGSDLRAGPQIAWQRDTWLKPADQAQLADHAINRACNDVSKSRVDEIWASVAGYSLSVDPLVTTGRMVVKSEKNARHDWRPVNGPLRRREPGMVYERFIDSVVGDHFLQTRPVIMRGQVPLVYDVRFPKKHWRAEAETFPLKVSDAYSPAEIELIVAFSAAIGLEYGELDVLRETATGQLFVIDANPTPVGPHHIAADEQAAFLRQMADAFGEVFGADLAR